MINVKNFQPRPGQTKNITLSTSPQNVSVQCESGRNCAIRVINTNTTVAFVEFYHTTTPGTAVSATVSMPVLPNTDSIFEVGTSESGIVICHALAPAGTGVIYFTPGEGI